jgi:RNA recognition motif-containing protein
MGNRLFVGNLPFDTSESDVRAFVEGEGRTVQSVKIVTDKETGRSRGFAFVDVGNDSEAQAAIAELNGKELGGRALVVNEAQDRGAGKFGGGGGGQFRGTSHSREERRGGGGGGFGIRGQNMPRGSQRGGGRGGTRGS